MGNIGTAFASGSPVVFRYKDSNRITDVICEKGKEKEALELMHKMNLINLMRPEKIKENTK